MSENKKGKNAAFDFTRYGTDQIQKVTTESAAETAKPVSAEKKQPLAATPIPADFTAEPATTATEAEATAPTATIPPEIPAPAEASAPSSKPVTRSGGRKTKTAAGTRKAKATITDEKSYEKTVTVYMSEEEHTRYKVSCIMSKRPLSDFFLDATRAYYRHTFVCNDASCGAEFTVPPSANGSAAPSFCPCCGGKKFTAVKF